MWAFYSIILKKLDSKYSTLFITRKVFFYGIITLLPTFLFTPLTTDTHILFQPVVFGNFIFLGVIASMVCYISWNMSIIQVSQVQLASFNL
jgi:drug/metabolite transporter (DMT)-like permease